MRRRHSRTLIRAQRYPYLATSTFHLRAFVHGAVAAVLLAVTLLGARFPTTVVAGSAGTAPLQVASLSLPGLAASAPSATVTRLVSAPVASTVIQTSIRQGAVLRAADTTQQALSALGERQAQSSAGAGPGAGTVSAARSAEQQPLFYRYEVQSGDTVSGIAARFGIESKYILWNNIDIISDQHALALGSKLQVPSVEGILHQVKVGETISEIASQYDAKVSAVVSFPANGLANNPNLLVEGSTIIVPGGKVVPRPAATLRPQLVTVAPAPATAPAAVASNIVSRPQSRAGFIWPVVNNVTSLFGPSHPLGIDIEAPYVPVTAARAGQIVFAGGDPCCSYGLNIIIRHDGGYETRYAHLSTVGVKLGQFVEVGQSIGITGATGRVTGPHLHFEVLLNGVIQNPMAYLP